MFYLAALAMMPLVGAALDLVGSYTGVSDFYKFEVNSNLELGGDVTVWNDQLNRIDILEQNGTFVRGEQYNSGDYGDTWFFVSYFFGEISQKSKNQNIYTVRLQEYFNKVNTSNPHDQAETLGLLVGYYDSTTEEMYLDYTGQTLTLQAFGAQSFVATRIPPVTDDEEDAGDVAIVRDIEGGWTTVYVLIGCLMTLSFGGVFYVLHHFFDIFGLKENESSDSKLNLI